MKKLFEWAKLLFGALDEFRQHQENFKALQNEVRQLTLMVHLLGRELQHSREVEKMERQNLRLEIENEMLRKLSSPPPPPPPPQP